MTDASIGFAAKIRRAKEHLGGLKESFSPFTRNGEAYNIVKKVNQQAGEFVFYLQVHREPPLIDWSLAIGDCLHNTRTALDHLFWALTVKHNPSGVSGKTSRSNFPILKRADTFKGRKTDLEGCVGSQAFALLEKLQPFNDPKGSNKNLLMFLSDFDNTDKHKLLVPAISISDSVKIIPETVDGREITLDGHTTLLGFEDGTEIARFKVRNPADVVDLNLSISFDVVFENQPGPLRVLPTLASAIKVVEAVGSEFAPLL